MKDNFIKLPSKKILNLDYVREMWITHRIIKPNNRYPNNEYNEYIISLSVENGIVYELSFCDKVFDNTINEYYEYKKWICKYLDVNNIDIIELR